VCIINNNYSRVLKGFLMSEMLVMSRDEVRAFDSMAINELGVAGVVLMENAGRGAAEVIVGTFNDEETQKIGIFCGTGNNGGDGYVIARHLLNWGMDVDVIICGDKEKISGDALVNLKILEKIGQHVDVVDSQSADAGQAVGELIKENGYTLVVDSIFGTGLQGELRGGYAGIIRAINTSGAKITAIDIPSGLECDSGQPLVDHAGVSAAIKADVTVTFVAVKKGFKANPDSSKYIGEVYVTSIGVEPSL
jgi:NAD(P)H-hydrate epimerase